MKEMDQPIFSVIVTAFNQPQDIKRAVESVLNQTVKCFELIVVDDCSTDNTPEVLSNYAEKNLNMRVVRLGKNSSSHAARCTGVENARGSYVLFLDGDDYLFPDALEKLLNQVVKGSEDFDVCEYSYQCQPGGKIISPATYDSALPRIDYYLRRDAIVTVWNKLYKSSVLKEAFNNMQVSYIRSGDDTYETICISYFTKKYIQKDILVINYQLENGVSFHKNNYESNIKHCQSLKTSLDCLKSFFEKNEYAKKTELLNNVETKFFEWILSVMKDNTELEDVAKSLIILPLYFSGNLILPHFNYLYKNKLRIKRVKQKIKKLLNIHK